MGATNFLSLLLLGHLVPETTSRDDASVDPGGVDDVLLWQLDEDGWD